MRRFLICAAVFGLATSASAGPMDTLLEVVSPEAEWCMVVPNLDRAGDDMANMIEGMDRAGLLLGNRPLDLLKSFIGLNSGVDDFGCGGLVAMPTDDESVAWVMLIPYTELDLFLSANFDPTDEADAFQHGDGTVWYARAIKGHVVLAQNAEAVRGYDAGVGIDERLTKTVGTRGRAVITAGDLAMAGTRRGWHAVIETLKPADANNPVGSILDGLHYMMNEVDFGVLSLDFDPLALIVRDFMVLREGSALGRESTGGESTIANLATLPNVPFMMAGSMDIRGLGGVAAVKARLELLGLPTDVDWLTHVDGLEMMLPPPDGRTPITDHLRMILHGSDPEAIVEDIHTSLRSLGEVRDGIVRHVTVESDDHSTTISLRPASLGIHPPLVTIWPIVADDFGADAARRMLGGNVVSAAGLFLTLEGHGDWIDVRGRKMSSVQRVRPAGAVDALAADFVVATMRSWMPADPDIEMYVNPAMVAKQFASSLAGLRMFGIVLPAFVEEAPPVGISIDVQDGTVQTTTIVPSGVTAPLADALISSGKER